VTVDITGQILSDFLYTVDFFISKTEIALLLVILFTFTIVPLSVLFLFNFSACCKQYRSSTGFKKQRSMASYSVGSAAGTS